MEMKDMKLTVVDRKKMRPAMVGSMQGPDYPWGLEIRLDAASLKKLGIVELPDAGEECVIHAMGKVTEVREATTANAAGKSQDRSMVIQITKLALMVPMGKESDDEAWDRAKKTRRER